MNKNRKRSREKRVLKLNIEINYLAACYASYISEIENKKTNDKKLIFFDTYVYKYIQETDEQERKYLLSKKSVKDIILNYEKKADYLKKEIHHENKLS